MMMIEKVTGIEFVKVIEIADIKPQAPTEPIISMNVPSSLVVPRSTRFDTAPPPPTSPFTGSILRVLKSMFRMCRDMR
jgi:hypothetical protein